MLIMRIFFVVLCLIFLIDVVSIGQVNDESTTNNGNDENIFELLQDQEYSSNKRTDDRTATSPPNVLIFLVDDLGWNQVGYHANPVGNNEIKTPHIDSHANMGIKLERGYMTPWCGPSRAAIMTGRTNSYNGNISTSISSFDDDIGYVGGLPPGTHTLATAFKEYGESIGHPYKAYYNGKWGIGGTAWTNTALGMGFDEFRGFWGNGIEVCDGMVPILGATVAHQTIPLTKDYGPIMVSALPGYWEQHPEMEDAPWCDTIKNINDGRLTDNEKFIACKTQPRTPPKHIDLDQLDKVREQILNHRYDEGPMLQFFSTAMMHLPIAYPKEYDEDPDLPEYFREGQQKPKPSADDLRYGTNMALRFVDDLFASTMQAIKDAGQWDNTIVWFTSDNGGAIYNGNANNNYPLRAAKFSGFEGGVRVAQFLTGGWIEKISPRTLDRVSDTYIFPSDIGPTLLEMAGGNKDFLLKGQSGATYGNSMWKYINNSVGKEQPNTSHQKPRKVSYSKDMYFDVQADKTFKYIYTGIVPQWTPRLWESVYPRNGDIIMDSSYYSVQPCRPDGIPLDCCLLNIEEDWQENMPLEADCHEVSAEARQLFVIEGGCPKTSDGKHLNTICIEPGGTDEGVLPSKLSLWSHYGASGPFTNSKGVPIDDFSMKCSCLTIDPGTSESEVNFFTLPLFSPTECIDRNSYLTPVLQGVPCDGSLIFSIDQGDYLKRFEEEGIDYNQYHDLIEKEIRQILGLDLPAIVETLRNYAWREGFEDWPNLGKFPFVIDGTDTCKEKGVSPVPWPAETITPYMLGVRDPTKPRQTDYPVGLCALGALNIWFCPSHDNPLLDPVVEWDFGDRISLDTSILLDLLTFEGVFGENGLFGEDGILFGQNGLFDPDRDWGLINKPSGMLGRRPYGVFADGRKFESLSILECPLRCPIRAEGTAYIGNGPHGLTV